MKKCKLWAVCLIALSFAACGDDDNEWKDGNGQKDETEQQETPQEPQEPESPVAIEGEKATLKLEQIGSTAEVAAAIADADVAGVTEYMLYGPFDKLGITGELPADEATEAREAGTGNPFRNTKVKVIDMTHVTGWPDVTYTMKDKEAGTLKGMPENAFYGLDREMNEFFPSLEKIILPEEVQVLGKLSFGAILKLVRLEAPGLKHLGKNSLTDCTALAELETPEVVSVGAYALLNTPALKEVNFPKLAEVDYLAFSESSFEKADFPELVETVHSTFSDAAISSVNLPKLQKIGDGDFQATSNLTEVYLPEVTTVGRMAFGLSAVKTIRLPKAFVFSPSAFGACHNLTLLELTGAEEIDRAVFDATPLSTIENCDLILGEYWQDLVEGNVWLGLTWKSITFKP